MAKIAPPAGLAALGAETQKLAEWGIAKRALAVGSSAPILAARARGGAVTLRR
jgi:hypothetical protein